MIDALYAGLGVAGASALLQVGAVRLTLGIVGALVLAAIGFRTLHSAFRVRLGGESDEEIASPRRAFLTSLGATASNPLTIASWAAAFSAASTAALAGSAPSAAVLVAGVGAGTLTWFTILSGGLTLARRRVGTRLLVWVDAVSGVATSASPASSAGARSLTRPDSARRRPPGRAGPARTGPNRPPPLGGGPLHPPPARIVGVESARRWAAIVPIA